MSRPKRLYPVRTWKATAIPKEIVDNAERRLDRMHGGKAPLNAKSLLTTQLLTAWLAGRTNVPKELLVLSPSPTDLSGFIPMAKDMPITVRPLEEDETCDHHWVLNPDGTDTHICLYCEEVTQDPPLSEDN